MELTQKETSYLKDYSSEEQLCIEKYTRYSQSACDPRLTQLFEQIKQTEVNHLQTVNEIMNGTVPNTQNQQGSQGQSQNESYKSEKELSAEETQNDKFLCSDALATEKHVSSVYNTGIFEFKNTNIRQTLNHIQKEEQEHGEKIYKYMEQNGMYS